jgi:hypothetical protein
MTFGRRDRPDRPDRRPPTRPASGGPAEARGATPAPPLPAVVVGEAEPLGAALDALGAGRAVEVVARLSPEAGLDPSPAIDPAALVLAPWPAALAWLARAPRGSPLGGRWPLLLVGGDPPRARLLVETAVESLPAARRPAGPLAGLAEEVASLRAENRELKEALEARKAIERAKGILMQQEGIGEAEAFSRIQRLSMSKRRPMKEVAEAIILSRELTGRS